MSDVFISYARPQRPHVDRMAAALRDLDLDVWFDRNLTPGEDFPAAIEEEARAARAMVVCWTPDSFQSPWVKREAAIGKAAGVLVPVFLRACTPPAPFDTLHTIDLVRWSTREEDSRWDDVLRRLEGLTGRNGLVTAWRAIVLGRSNELVTRVRRELIRLARERATTSYPLMAALMTVDQPTLWAALDACAEENRSRREPPLCALVISDRTERPGKGYFQKHAFLKDDFDPLAQVVWAGHRDRVWAHDWSDD